MIDQQEILKSFHSVRKTMPTIETIEGMDQVSEYLEKVQIDLYTRFPQAIWAVWYGKATDVIKDNPSKAFGIFVAYYDPPDKKFNYVFFHSNKPTSPK